MLDIFPCLDWIFLPIFRPSLPPPSPPPRARVSQRGGSFRGREWFRAGRQPEAKHVRFNNSTRPWTRTIIASAVAREKNQSPTLRWKGLMERGYKKAEKTQPMYGELATMILLFKPAE